MGAAEKGPQRTCVACRQTKDKGQLIRYVVAPDGEILVDYRQRLPGRGAYTCLDVQCLQSAIKKKSFQRCFRGACHSAEADVLAEQLVGAIKTRIINLIGISRKSGQCISGSNAVIEALRKESPLALVLIAENISASIGQKICGLTEKQDIFCIRLYDKQKIGQILGKEERSVIAVQSGSLADSLLEELHRYKQLVREN